MTAPRYKLTVDRLASDIRSGRLPAGTRLPTHRCLAADEGIGVVTASRVYSELEAMGLVSGEQGRGTFVRDTTLPPGHGTDQRPVAPGTVDLSFNYPTVPGQGDLLRHALRELATSGDLDALLRYQPHRGRPQDRASVAQHLQQRGLDADGENVLILNGAQHGLAVTAMATLRAGDLVATDALTYPGFTTLANTFGLELAALPTTPDGPDLDALHQLCTTRPVRAVYAMPTLHNPLGWVMDAAACEHLIEIARRHGLLIIEDASYAYLAPDAPPPLAALAPETTVYVSGLSKNVATGLRFGFLAAPTALVPALERTIRATAWNTLALTATIACRWLDDGTVDRLEAQKRADAQARQRVAREVLTDLPLVAHPSSYFLWVPLPADARADRIAAELHKHHILVSTAEPYATTSTVPQALRLALGSTTNLNTLRTALTAVREVLQRDALL